MMNAMYIESREDNWEFGSMIMDELFKLSTPWRFEWRGECLRGVGGEGETDLWPRRQCEGREKWRDSY